MGQEGQPEISGDSLFMVALSVGGSAYDLVLLEVDLFLRTTTVAGQFDNRSSAGLVTNQVHINSFFTLAQASDPPEILLLYAVKESAGASYRNYFVRLDHYSTPGLHRSASKFSTDARYILTQRAYNDEWACFCGHKAGSTSGIYFFMLELGDQSEILRSVQLTGFEDSSMTNYRCAHLEITSTQSVSFLLISDDFALYTPSAVTLDVFSEKDVRKITQATNGEIYETLFIKAFYGAYKYNSHYFWLGNSDSLGGVNFPKSAGHILSTYIGVYCFDGPTSTTISLAVTS